MGVIDAANTLQFKSSKSMFDRIKKRLASYNQGDFMDRGDFHKLVAYQMEQWGLATYRECEAVIEVKGRKGKLPPNFKILHAAYKCTPEFNHGSVASINEQRPWIYYTQVEATPECPNQCCIKCVGEPGRTRIVVRTFVNGDDARDISFKNPTLLRVSANVREICTEDSLSLNCSSPDEITISDGHVSTASDFDSIFFQYYGQPLDENGLPMIPEDETYEKALEYYIYTEIFQTLYWNAIPNVVNFYQDAKADYAFYAQKAKIKAVFPSFQKMIEMIRRQRTARKFYYFPFDQTIINNTTGVATPGYDIFHRLPN